MKKRIHCSDCPLRNVEVDTLCEEYCSDMADFIEEIRANAIEEVIKLYEEFQPKLATNVYEFGERLRQMQKGKEKNRSKNG